MSYVRLFIIASILMVSCKTENNRVFSELDDCENISPTSGVTDYETQWFQYPDTVTYRHIHDLCVVKYYVDADTLYTSEKYHFMTLGYSWEEDSSMAYQHIIFFDRTQQPDNDGWYRIGINKHDIPREPGTYISSIALRCYMGEKYEYKKLPHADAHLFNATKEISCARDRTVLSPQLQKLYPIIR